jgi:hypothetical protein
MLGNSLRVANLEFDSRNRTIADDPRILSARETAVLELLMRNKGWVVSKKRAEDHIFGLSGEVDSNAVEVYVHRLRKQMTETFAANFSDYDRCGGSSLGFARSPCGPLPVIRRRRLADRRGASTKVLAVGFGKLRDARRRPGGSMPRRRCDFLPRSAASGISSNSRPCALTVHASHLQSN